MKRLLFTLLICALTLSVNAQDHLTVMGIPVDGTITEFTQKLKAKGMKHDIEHSKTLPVGGRLFYGTFFGEEGTTLYVAYNPKTKIVYQVNVCFTLSSSEQCLKLKDRINENLKSKYKEGLKETKEYDYFVNVFNEKTNTTDQLIGAISLVDNYMSNGYYSLTIMYEDYINSVKNTQQMNSNL